MMVQEDVLTWDVVETYMVGQLPWLSVHLAVFLLFSRLPLLAMHSLLDILLPRLARALP